ncbi:MAG: hypothetical protein FJX66_00900 [Alphaproteobacteria bacterium]|nr:hypothetical protein [Alphaproteobacteria bacterium]
MRKLLIMALFAVLAVATPLTARALPTLEEIKQGAEYSQSLNVLIAGFSQVYEETTSYDVLADAVFSGQMSDEDAARNVQELSMRLRARHAELSAQLAASPPPPSVVDDQMRRTLATTLQMAESTRSVTLEAIEAGERLVEAGRHRDENFYLQRTIKNLELTRGQIANQAMLYQQQIDIKAGPNVSFYLYSAMKAEADVLVHLLSTQIELVKGNQVGPEAFAGARDIISQGYGHVANGRSAYDQMLAAVNAAPSAGPADDANRQIVLDALSNIPTSFDVEGNLLNVRTTYVNGVEAGSFDDAALASFQQQASALENMRIQLQIERQQKLQALQGG